ncbi:hypothetical protein JL720_10522 [Aureococcus anophagefferens]|nr:hypothetical protein JL720_10522 [Aureococcus anophagefferens]
MSAVWTTLPSGSVKTAVKVAQALEADGTALGQLLDGIIVGADEYDTWKSMESVTEASPSHVSVSVYSLTVASPETTCVTWPSLSKMSAVWTTLPSGSVKTAVKVVQAPESPR